MNAIDRACLDSIEKSQHGRIGGFITNILSREISQHGFLTVMDSLEKLAEAHLVSINDRDENGFPRIVHLLNRPDSPDFDRNASSQIPASDRTVEINHNSVEYITAKTSIEEVIRQIEEKNFYPEPYDKQDIVGRLENGKSLLENAVVVVKDIDQKILKTLIYLERRAIAVTAVAAAIAAIRVVIGL